MDYNGLKLSFCVLGPKFSKTLKSDAQKFNVAIASLCFIFDYKLLCFYFFLFVSSSLKLHNSSYNSYVLQLSPPPLHTIDPLLTFTVKIRTKTYE